jgi:hypothetical protein
MLPIVKMWDKDKFEALFSMDVANCILEIPLFDEVEEDKLIWCENIHGQYNVKSGYKLMFNVSEKGDNIQHQDSWNSL